MSIFRVNSDGTFDIMDADSIVVAGVAPQVIYRDATNQERILGASGSNEARIFGADENLEMEWSSDGDSASIRVVHRGTSPVYLERLNVAVGLDGVNLGRVSDLAYLQHGWQSWSPVRVRPLRSRDDSYDGDDYAEKHLPHGKPGPGEVTSEWFTVIGQLSTERAMLVGFVTAADELGEIRLTIDGDEITRLQAISHADGAKLDPGGRYSSERLTVAFGEPRRLVEDYSSRLGREMKARTQLRPLSGWCSWYYFFGQNTADDLAANLSEIGERRLPLQLFLIDDGYQAAIGDWTRIDADKFPDGMRSAVDAIRAAGRIPGIWVAPFGARHDSRLVFDHPEYLLRDGHGQPVLAWHHWGEPVYALDLTHPGCLEHLANLFHIVCDEWGFDLVKLDFIYAGALTGVHHDPHATRIRAYRQGLETIRQAIGTERIILGCGAPQAASVGLVDAMRVSQDVSIAWKPTNADPGGPSTKQALQNSLFRSPFHRRLWVNDPDCVLVRKRGNLNLMSRNQVRTLMTLATLMGGFTLDSDNLAEMPEAQLDDLLRILPPSRDGGKVIDYFGAAGRPPQRVELKFKREWAEWRVIAFTNWTGRTLETCLPLGEPKSYRVYDFWRKRYIGIRRGEVELTQGPYMTNVLIMSETGQEPGVIASSFHVLGGDAEISKFERLPDGLRVVLEKEGYEKGELIFSIPAHWRRVHVHVDGQPRRARQIDTSVVSVRLTLDRRVTVELEG